MATHTHNNRPVTKLREVNSNDAAFDANTPKSVIRYEDEPNKHSEHSVPSGELTEVTPA